MRDLGPKVDLTVGGDGLELHELQVLRGELQLRERNTILFTEEQAGLSGSSLKVKSKSTLLSIFQFVCTDREIEIKLSANSTSKTVLSLSFTYSQFTGTLISQSVIGGVTPQLNLSLRPYSHKPIIVQP